MKKTLPYVIKAIAYVFFCCIVIWLFLTSGFSTTTIDYYEHSYLIDDNIWINSLWTFSFVIMLWGIKYKNIKRTRIKKPNHKKVYIAFVAILATELLFILFVFRKAPRADQKYIIECSNQWLKKDFSSLNQGGYLDQYHNQFGIVLIVFWISKIVGTNNYLVFQFINAVSIMWIYVSISKILNILLPQSNMLTICSIIIGIIFLPLNLYLNFVYGTVIGLACILYAFYCLCKSQYNHKVTRIITACVLMMIAVMIKQNYLIFCIGLFLYCLYEIIESKNWPYVFPMIVCISLVLWSEPLVISLVEGTTNNEIRKEGISPWAYIAMGLQENEVLYDGWWNEYTINSYEACKYTKIDQEEKAKESITGRLSEFSADPEYAIAFFSGKNASQWNNPDFQCFWINWKMPNDGDIEYPEWLNLLLSTQIAASISTFLNRFHFIILSGLIPYIIYRKKSNIEFFLYVTFLGGFVFHTFWEAKGQYALPFFVLLIPLSMLGWREVYARIPCSRMHFSKGKAIKQFSILILCVVLLSLIQGRYIDLSNESIYRNEDTLSYRQYLKDNNWVRISNGRYLIYNEAFGKKHYITSKESCNSSADVYLSGDLSFYNEIEIISSPTELKTRFHFVDNDKYLDVPGGTVDNDEPLWAYRNNDSFAQKWRLLYEGDDTYYIITQNNKEEYVAITINEEENAVVLSPFKRAKEQMWKIKQLDYGL